MKTIKVLSLSFLGMFMLMSFAANKKEKKVQNFRVEKVIPLAAEKVWAIVAEDYGAIANSHPAIIKSEYLNGSLKGGEGAERVCYFNEEGTQFLKEKMVDFDPANMQFTNTVYRAGKFPVDPAYTKAIYKVEKLSNNECKLSFDMTYRTDPAVMGPLMKGNFKNLIEDYMIAVEHHASTGEVVNKENFKEIKKQYN